jgi:farnesyl diphosphate synthase
MGDDRLGAALAACAHAAGRLLEARMDALAADAISEGRARLVRAMRHAALGGGKRIRPFLALEAARAAGSKAIEAKRDALIAGIAVELIHCYSLAHDDLPSMDNDTVRRGMPTVHVAFDEATAILAGDALQALAFEVLADLSRPALGLALCLRLARASGAAGMVGGQMLDLAAEGRFPADGGNPAPGQRIPLRLPLEGISEVQSLKTGAIIGAAVEMGALCGGLDEGSAGFAALSAFGAHFGRGFQISDDLIDATGDAAVAGKAVAKDDVAGKATFVSALGLDGAKKRLAAEIAAGEAALATLPGPSERLAALLRSMAERSS